MLVDPAVEVAVADVARRAAAAVPAAGVDPGDLVVNSIGMKLAYIPPGVHPAGAMRDVFDWARDVEPDQPLTSGLWTSIKPVPAEIAAVRPKKILVSQRSRVFFS